MGRLLWAVVALILGVLLIFALLRLAGRLIEVLILMALLLVACTSPRAAGENDPLARQPRRTTRRPAHGSAGR